MYKRIITAIIALAHVLPSPQVSAQSCPPPTTFTLSEITYLRYEVSANVPTAPVNTTQLVFAITNAATGISTGCALQSVPRSDGAWPSGQATTCLERTITVGGKDYPVQTSARVDWDAWRLTVNQTWVCRESVTVSQFSALTLVPTCTENKTVFQYIKECTAPDIVVAATLDGSIAV